MTKTTRKKKQKLTVDNIQIEIYKTVANVVETLGHFKDILNSIIEMGIKTSTDIQVMNQKWSAIKDNIKQASEDIDEIKNNTTTMLAQLDLKEKQRFVKEYENKKNGKENDAKKTKWWTSISDFFSKNPWVLVILIVVLAGIILVVNGYLSGDVFWKGITGEHLSKP
jgi:Ni,Fe-hydrogenase I large subunit